MKKVIVFTTGGTIAMKYDEEKGGLVPAVSGEDLAAAVPGLSEVTEVEVREFSNVASCNMTPQLMFRLSRAIEKALDEEDAAGAVVTHGTDTLEETAYMLDLLHGSEKPICVVGAMRGASDTSADGPANIWCAVKVASSDEARGKGVFAVLNNTIHAAREVRKTHSANCATFESPWWGPVGYCDEDRVVFRRAPVGRRVFHPAELTARVDVIQAQSGIGRNYIDFAVRDGANGIVVEGFGRGNIPPAMEEGISDAVKAGVAVVISTRAFAGRPYESYAYPGSVGDSKRHGAVRGGELSAAKTRLKLMVILSEHPELARMPSDLEKLMDD
ncbi:MAG: asparaginase [Mesosutterella sp.]|nr:asparaginase [Mesosutterella sp.]